MLEALGLIPTGGSILFSHISEMFQRVNVKFIFNKNHDVLHKYAEQVRLQREWEEKIESLNEKYNLDCFSSFELDLSDEEEKYRYEHKYETLI